jgi:DNA-binding CsgD family transcriptional regulator
MYSGYDDLVACEIEYYKGLFSSAKQYARRAIIKAREKKQYSVEADAQYYLLRVSIHECDYPQTKELFKQLHAHLDNQDFWNRQLIYDLSAGVFNSMISLPGLTPSWLLMNEKDDKSEVRIPARELLVIVSNCLAQKNYDRALAVLHNSHPRLAQERFALGELCFSLFSAVAKFKTGDTPIAIADFQKAFELSFNGVFETPFIEQGRDLTALISAFSGQPGNDIPAEWLRSIGRKASAYAKKAAVIRESYLKDKDLAPPILLTHRERKVLNDLYHGLNREEIAATRFLSVHTVKKAIESIYVKLDAANIADAIRAGLKNGLIDQ